jgi:anti-sigma factor RsiW
MMDCIELVELVTDYLEGALPEADRRRFDLHLTECPYCVDYLAQMRATLNAIGWIPPESISPIAKARLSETFSNWKRAQSKAT